MTELENSLEDLLQSSNRKELKHDDERTVDDLKGNLTHAMSMMKTINSSDPNSHFSKSTDNVGGGLGGKVVKVKSSSGGENRSISTSSSGNSTSKPPQTLSRFYRYLLALLALILAILLWRKRSRSRIQGTRTDKKGIVSLVIGWITGR